MTVHPSVGVSPRKGRSGARLTALSLFFFLFYPFPGFQRRDPLPAQQQGGPPSLRLRALLTASSLGPQGGAQGTPGSRVETAATGSLGNSPSVALLMPRSLSGSQSTFSKEMKSVKDQEETTLWLRVS